MKSDVEVAVPSGHSLDDLKILRPAAVAGALGVSETTLKRLRDAGRFPTPISLGENAIGWPSYQVREYLVSMLEAGGIPRA